VVLLTVGSLLVSLSFIISILPVRMSWSVVLLAVGSLLVNLSFVISILPVRMI
jgi:hypothetical protein